MSQALLACPSCHLAATRRNGRNRQVRQIHQCRGCCRRFTALSVTPCSGDRFPPDGSALAGRWSLRFRLSDADVAARLAERGIQIDPATISDGVRALAPLDEDAARPFRRAVGRSWRGDETDTKIAGKAASVDRAIAGQGQVVDVAVRQRRATADAAACFRRAIAATGGVPAAVTTDGAAAYPPALAVALPPVAHEASTAAQPRIVRDHQHLKGRLRPLRVCKTLAGARVFCRGHAFLRNLRGGFSDLGRPVDPVALSPRPPVVEAWVALTGVLLGR